MGRTYWHCGATIFEVFRGDSCDHLEDCRVHGTERVGGMVWLLRVLTTCHSGKMTSVPSSPIATADWRWYCGWSVKSHGQMRFKALLHIWLEPKVGTELLYLPVSDFSITSLSRDMPKKNTALTSRRNSFYQFTLLAVAGCVVPGKTRMTRELLGHPVDPMIAGNVIAPPRRETSQDLEGSWFGLR